MKFDVGDKVSLCPSSSWYTRDNSDCCNPTDVAGEVIRASSSGLLVRWESGKHLTIQNCYKHSDLLLLEESMKDTSQDTWESLAHPLKVTKAGKIRWNYPDGGIGTFDIKALATRAGSTNLIKIAALMMAYAEDMNQEKAKSGKESPPNYDEIPF